MTAKSGSCSLLLGSLRLIDETKGDHDKLRRLIDKRFDELDWLDRKSPEFLRHRRQLPIAGQDAHGVAELSLHILHEYKVDAKTFLAFISDMETCQPIRWKNCRVHQPNAFRPARRHTYPAAYYRHASPENIIFSAAGIREGYLYESCRRRPQPRWASASCTEFAAKGGRSTAYANELYTWMFPLVTEESERERRLRLAFCLLSDIALHIHPEYRANGPTSVSCFQLSLALPTASVSGCR